MLHKDTETVPDGGTNERKVFAVLENLAPLRNTKFAIISRGAESTWWDVQFNFKEERKVRRSSASDHAVADCSNLVFYSAFYWQPVQIHKEPGSLAGMGSSTVHHTLNFVCKCLRDAS